MPPSRDEVIRVGLRLVIVALVAGLLVLMFNPTARSGEMLEPSEREALLLEPNTPRTTEERAEEAKTLLRADKRRKATNLATHVIDVGMRAAASVSPKRLLKGVRDVVKDVVHWRRRTPSEERALALLENGNRAGRLDDATSDLYRELSRREREERSKRLLEEAEHALEAGRLWRARRAARRALELDAHPERAASLLDRLDASDVASTPTVDTAPSRSIERWEAPLAAAMLVGDYDRVAALGADRPDAKLARAVARYLGGEHDDALESLSLLGEQSDAVGSAARGWLSDARLNPEVQLSEELARYKRRRTLGWVGGVPLADHGLDLSLDSYAAWRDSLSPMNLAVAAPSRLVRGWQPDSSALRSAADRYLAILPRGERSDEARHWLEVLPVASGSARASVWQDGLLVLPPPETDYRRVDGRPVLVSLNAIDEQWLRDLGVETEGADAVLLSALVDDQSEALELASSDALELVAHLAEGLEGRTLDPPADQQRGAVLEALRGLDGRARAGARVGIETWVYVDATSATVSLQNALDADTDQGTGISEYLGGVALVRGRKDVRVNHEFSRVDQCPEELYCIVRARALTGGVYASFGVNGDMQLGAHTRLAQASFSFALDIDGAHASFSLPVARWLGLGRWIPMEANVGIGFGGISFGTRLADPVVEAPPAAVY